MSWSSPVLANPGYRADIDGLRAVAVIFVLLGHFLKEYFPGGFAGVDIFFVISGYLIGSIIFKGLDAGNFSFLVFYAKRARRIFPALIFMLLGSLVLGALFLTPVEYSEMGGNGFRGAFFVENFWLARGTGYFDLSLSRNPMMHLWSLGVEEQFYLVFPLLMWLSWRCVGQKTIWVVLILVFASFLLGIYYLQYSESRAYFWPHARFWELGTGALLGYINVFKWKVPQCRRILDSFHRAGSYGSILAISVLMLFLFFWNANWNFPGYWAIVPVVCSVILIGSGIRAGVNRFLATPWMVYIGWLSYPLYLWHWLLYSIAYCVYDGRIPAIGVVCVLGATILLSVVSMHCVEFPIRRYQPNQLLLSCALGLLLLIGLTCGFIRKLDGLPSRIPNYVPLVSAAARSETQPLYACRYVDRMAGTCWSSNLTQDAQVVLIGNSHAQHVARAFVELAPRDISVDVLANGGINLLHRSQSGPKASDQRRDASRDWILQTVSNSNSRIVVFSNTWFSMPPNDRRMKTVDGPEEKVDVLFRRTLELFLASGKKVVLMVDNPKHPHEIEACFRYRPLNLIHPDCDLPHSEYLKQSTGTNQYFNKLRLLYPGQVYVIDASEGVCRNGICPVQIDGQGMYSDSHHFTEFGAGLYAKEIWRQLEPIVRDK